MFQCKQKFAIVRKNPTRMLHFGLFWLTKIKRTGRFASFVALKNSLKPTAEICLALNFGRLVPKSATRNFFFDKPFASPLLQSGTQASFPRLHNLCSVGRDAVRQCVFCEFARIIIFSFRLFVRYYKI